MKRDPNLQPLSREHHFVLAQARAIRWALSGREGTPLAARDAFLLLWNDLIARHFVAEERWILPLIERAEDVERMRHEHANLRGIADELAREGTRVEPDPERLRRLADALDDHVRWEERELFPAIEAGTSPERLREAGEGLAGGA
ncbi:MAG TPA: hemerythrin domain-containing protein [Planctomycetota bacterium]|jgi:hemerythrin-like domain-containing protein|nr:hemerythrin domain-containing protein [Planctomycetota bacterium]